jgi:hypothetical protein
MEEITVKCEEVDSVKIKKDDQTNVPLNDDSVYVTSV